MARQRKTCPKCGAETYVRRCASCLQPFESRNKIARFCGINCRMRAYRRRAGLVKHYREPVRQAPSQE